MDYINQIKTRKTIMHPSGFLKYQPIGKLLWTKLHNGDIIRVRCKSVFTMKDEVCLIHEYEGADGKTYIGSAFGIKTCRCNGCTYFSQKLYDNYDDCKCDRLPYGDNGSCYGTQPNTIDLFELIKHTYNDAECAEISAMDYLTITGYKPVNGKIRHGNVNFAIWIDKNGEHFDVREFDNEFCYPSQKMAYQHYQPKVLDFIDDNEECSVKKTTTITITITEKQKLKLSELGLI